VGRPNAQLDHLAIQSETPAALADFYARLLGSVCVSVGGDWLQVTKDDRCLLFSEGKPGTLAFAAYAFDDELDLAQLRARLGDRAEVLAATSPLWTDPRAFAVLDPDGNRIEFGIRPHRRDPRSESADSPSSATPAARLQHVVFASREPERLERFYVQVCGFGLSDHVLDASGEVRSAFLHADHEHHALAIFRAAENRLDHHCYEAQSWNDLRDWADYWSTLNLKIVWGPGRHGPGNNLFLFVNDPDGNWIEMSAELETLAESREPGRWPHEERTLNLWGHGKLRS
jgi:catechol 2,3-dioxygenase-like lactoylglutathione lyase family enzyme